MAGRDDHILQAEWDRLTKDLQITSYGTPSEPMETELDCFPQIKGDACVVTEISVVASSKDFVCTGTQSDELDTIWNREMASKPSASSVADAAVLARLREMRNELKQSLPQAACDAL
jgi:hypothetical protein